MRFSRLLRENNDKFSPMIGVTSVRLMSCPMVKDVPIVKANDAEPRTAAVLRFLPG